MSEIRDGNTIVGVPEELDKRFETYDYRYSFGKLTDIRLYKGGIEVVKAQTNSEDVWNIKLDLSNIGR